MKELSFHCPGCKQHIEAPRDYAGQQITCPTCQTTFKVPKPWTIGRVIVLTLELAFLLILLFAIAVVVYIKQIGPRQDEFKIRQQMQADDRLWNPEKYETHDETMARFKTEAEANMLKECSNYVGFQRVVDHYISTRENDDPKKWAADATIDFVNKVGGVERTNLLFRCGAIAHHGYCSLDEGAMWDRHERELSEGH